MPNHIREEQLSLASLIRAKSKAYVELLKMRLSLLVALSAVFGYAMAAPVNDWFLLLMIGLGGLLVTGASNVLNQIAERQLDGLMSRTQDRPMPTQRLNVQEAGVYAFVLAVLGVGILGYFFNLAAALLGIIGLLSYAYVYTPMKRTSTYSVFVGAIPGALPPMSGWVAYAGEIGSMGWLLFAFQFFWQFPHFWAIAWVLDEDYNKAGFKMLPTMSGRSRFNAQLIFLYTLPLVGIVLFPWKLGFIGLGGAIGLALLGLAFCIPAFRLWKAQDVKVATQLMFASFLYLPLMQVIFLIGA